MRMEQGGYYTDARNYMTQLRNKRSKSLRFHSSSQRAKVRVVTESELSHSSDSISTETLMYYSHFLETTHAKQGKRSVFIWLKIFKITGSSQMTHRHILFNIPSEREGIRMIFQELNA